MTAGAVADMIVELDVPIRMNDGLELRADVFRPRTKGPVPVIMTLGPYGKGVPYQEGYAPQWKWLADKHPDMLPGSTRSFEAWETPDPEVWSKYGYAYVRVDSRGAGRSPGMLDLWSPRENKDYALAIDWAGTQYWSNGKVGLLGVSYYAINQWSAAALQPKHLAAIVPWEGCNDHYRELARHGGIMSNAFLDAWYPRQVIKLQHGNPDGPMDPRLNERATGPEALSEAELLANRKDLRDAIRENEYMHDYYRDRTPDFSKITVPVLSAANWGGAALHQRGNIEGYLQAASKQKWLEIHPGRHEEWFYLEYGLWLQKYFLDHFLKGEDNGWDKEPPVWLHIRRPFTEESELRKENEWPLARTEWTKIFLDCSSQELDRTAKTAPGQFSFEAMKETVTLMSPPLEEELEITGPLAAKLYVSSSTTDADLFLTFQAWSPEGEEVEYQGALDPHTPLGQGWLRASHRKLDPQHSLPYRPYHSHDERQPLEPGVIYELDIEIWPTCITLPAGYRFSLMISGQDFERPVAKTKNEAWVSRGSGPWLHTDETDRPPSIYGRTTTVHSGPETPSYLLLPIIPANSK
ncbi:MAG: CocE/NonD family hydrolase [Rhizobiaceae bacterium]|nr:CocE/NonD family hydrolase [Rhizobiaceae bacterium]